MEFLSALKNEKHDHVIYMVNERSGKTTVDRKHSHEVMFVDERSAVTDPLTGAQVITGFAGYRIMPAGKDMHTHEIGPLQFTEKSEGVEAIDEEEIVKEVYKMRRQAQDFDRESREKALEDEKFLSEDQWDPEQKKYLLENDRPALTANTIQAKMKALDGYQRNNRSDFKYYPVEDGDVIGADIANEAAKIICERTNYWQAETQAFVQQASLGLGVLYGYIDYENDSKGFPKIKFIDWPKVHFGPHFELDGSDIEFFTFEEIFSKEKVKSMWPTKKAAIDDLMKSEVKDSSAVDLTSVDNYWDRQTVDKLAKTIRVIELHRYEYKTKYILIDKNNIDNIGNITNMDVSDINRLKTIDGVKIKTEAERVIRITRVAGNVFLDDEYPEMISDEFPLWPIYAEKKRSQWCGKVRYVKDLARLNNKNLSAGADILNKMNAYIWFLKETQFRTPEEMEKFKKNSSKPGYHCVLNENATDRPEKEQGVKFPSELTASTQNNLQLMDMILNINPELMGAHSNAESGYQELERKKAALQGNEYIFDNMSMTKRRIGKWYAHAMQKVLGAKRLQRMLSNFNQRQAIKLGGRDYSEYTPEQILAFIENADFTKYDVIVSETAMNASRRTANFIMLSELAARGVPIPPPLLLEFADLTDEQRQKAMDYLNQQMQAQQQSQLELQNMKSQMEIMKALIPALSKAGEIQGQPR